MNWIAQKRLLTAALVIIGILSSLALLSMSRDMPDFTEWPAGEARKTQFFGFLRPLVEAENARVLEQREDLERLAEAAAEDDLGWLGRRRLAALAESFGVPHEDVAVPEVIRELRLRVDTVPVSLALAQAAKESGWGTSRFAQNGHALFGERCFKTGCGMVPKARVAGLRHEVTHFDSAEEAVASYVRNLNTHPDYAEFRQRRAQLRRTPNPHPGIELAGSLSSYSERRDDYIREIRQMIRFNGLAGDAGDG
jgi:Bax protein